jgi:hypothetical protein
MTGDLNVAIGDTAQTWSETEFTHNGHLAILATALWVAGRPARGIEGRMLQALNSIRPSPLTPLVAVVTCEVAKDQNSARQMIREFLAKAAPLAELIYRLAGAEVTSITPAP